MQVYDNQTLRTKFADVRVKVDSYFAKRTSLQTNHTILKLGEYNLMGAPAFLSMDEAHMLCVLSPQEVTLFGKFSNVTNTLVLEFLNPDHKEPLRFIIRVNLITITQLPGNRNVCMIHLKFKVAPAEYIRIFGTFLEEQEGRKAAYEKYADQYIVITEDAARIMGYNNYAELLFEDVKNKVVIKEISSRHAKVNLFGGAENLVGKAGLHLKLYFKAAQFQVEASFPEGTKAEPGEAVLDLGFSNDLLNIYDDYQFKLTMAAKRKAAEAQ